MSKSRQYLYLLATAAMAFPLAVPAKAQQPAEPTNMASEEGEEDAEIVVTAQRREQRLSEVPASVTALTAEDLAQSGVVDTLDLQAVTPGLQFPVAGAFAQPTIRGIGTTVTSAGSDANVALYVDGVYMPSQAGNIFDFNNIQRVEVLKGPQGTLYGRNATGGAINVTTMLPSSDPLARFAASYGSFNEIRLNAYLSGPITEGIAVGVAGLYADDDGYSRDFLRNVDMATVHEEALRGRVLIDASDALTFVIAGDWSSRSDNRGYSLKPLNGNTAQAAANVSPDPYEVALSFTPVFKTESYGGSFTGTLDLGSVTASSITALRQVDANFVTDLDRTQVAAQRASFDTRQKTFTQELNLASDASGAFSWVAGLFYYDDRAENLNLVINGAPGIYGRIDSEAIAGYAEATFDVTDRLSLIGGLRYSTEERRFRASRVTGETIDTSIRYNAWTPRASVRFALTESANIYATYTSGFKSGTYNISAFSTVPVRPESVDALEVGFRSYKRGVTLNAAAFYYTYDDIQVQAIQPGTGLTALTNAAKAEIYGAEAEAEVPLTRAWNLRGGLALTHATYTDFPSALLTTPRLTGCGANPNRPCGNTQAAGDASGNTMVRSPRWTANLSIDHESVVAGGDLRASLTGSYNDGFFWDVGNRLEQDAYLLVNSRISWGPQGSFWRMGLWGRNLLDETYHHYVADTTQGDAVAYARPRSIGATLELSF